LAKETTGCVTGQNILHESCWERSIKMFLLMWHLILYQATAFEKCRSVEVPVSAADLSW